MSQCTCGAAKTSNTNLHSDWCDANPEVQLARAIEELKRLLPAILRDELPASREALIKNFWSRSRSRP